MSDTETESLDILCHEPLEDYENEIRKIETQCISLRTYITRLKTQNDLLNIQNRELFNQSKVLCKNLQVEKYKLHQANEMNETIYEENYNLTITCAKLRIELYKCNK
jgi:hypothetical protein